MAHAIDLEVVAERMLPITQIRPATFLGKAMFPSLRLWLARKT